MKCRDFERVWNEQLDAREAASAEVDRDLEAHAASCAGCRAIALRYQTLRQAIRALGPAPAAPADFADRFLARWDPAEVDPAPRIVRLRSTIVPLAAAAALLVAVVLGLRSERVPRVEPEAPAPTVAEAVDPRSLTDALARVTSATLDLARATSEPAARIGREVLDSAVHLAPETSPSLPPAATPGPDVLRVVGDRDHEGVDPLSGTAQHAFGFLLGPALDVQEQEPPPTSAHGA